MFFRYQADKHKVKSAGAADFECSVVDAVCGASMTVEPIDAVGARCCRPDLLGRARRQRQRILASSTELRERELIKLDTLTFAVACALRQRGVENLTATLVAAGVGTLTTAFQQWTAAGSPQDSWTIMDDALGGLRAAICGPR